MNVKGIDISEYQGSIRLSDCKSLGYDYAILRAGYTGYGASRTKNKDAWFEDFYRQAKELNYPVGAYWYSCADSKEQGIEEAKFLYENCLKGKQFEYPIYIDVEDPHWQDDNYEGVTEAIIAFCQYLEDLDYYVGIYASLSWFYSNFDTPRLVDYTKWVACWDSTKPDVSFSGFDMWQDSSSGQVGYFRVDTNYCYEDFPKIIQQYGFNGYELHDPVEPDPEPVMKSNEEIADEVINGLWGNDEDRYNRLTEAGYDYDAIQDIVNQKLAPAKQYYVVRYGDTLTDIANRFGVSVDYLVATNNIQNPNLIYVDQVLEI